LGLPLLQYLWEPKRRRSKLHIAFSGHFGFARAFLYRLRKLGHCRLGQQQDAGDRDCVFEGDPDDLGGVDNFGFDEVDVLLAPGVEASASARMRASCSSDPASIGEDELIPCRALAGIDLSQR